MPVQIELLDCIWTRHHSGRVREKHLRNIICSNHERIAFLSSSSLESM